MWTGILLALAALTKFLPAVVLPAFWRPKDWRLLIAFGATVLVLYLPYLSAGWRVLGFLGGYVSEEGVENGHGLFLLQLLGGVTVLPSWAAPAYIIVALALLAAGPWRDASHSVGRCRQRRDHGCCWWLGRRRSWAPWCLS